MKLIKIQRGNIDNKYVHVCGIDCVYYDNDEFRLNLHGKQSDDKSYSSEIA